MQLIIRDLIYRSPLKYHIENILVFNFDVSYKESYLIAFPLYTNQELKLILYRFR